MHVFRIPKFHFFHFLSWFVCVCLEIIFLIFQFFLINYNSFLFFCRFSLKLFYVSRISFISCRTPFTLVVGLRLFRDQLPISLAINFRATDDPFEKKSFHFAVQSSLCLDLVLICSVSFITIRQSLFRRTTHSEWCISVSSFFQPVTGRIPTLCCSLFQFPATFFRSECIAFAHHFMFDRHFDIPNWSSIPPSRNFIAALRSPFKVCCLVFFSFRKTAFAYRALHIPFVVFIHAFRSTFVPPARPDHAVVTIISATFIIVTDGHSTIFFFLHQFTHDWPIFACFSPLITRFAAEHCVQIIGCP